MTRESHHSNQSNSLISMVSNFNNIGIEIIHINRIIVGMANTYAKLVNQ